MSRPRGTHDPTTHYCFRIAETTPSVQARPDVENRLHLVHHGVICDFCPADRVAAGPIVGHRFCCVQCQVNLCEACEARGAHDPAHPRLKYAVPTPGRGAVAALPAPAAAATAASFSFGRP